MAHNKRHTRPVPTTRPPGRWIGALHRCAREYFGQSGEALGLEGFDVILLGRLLRRDDLSQEDLAGAGAVDKATVARSIARLEDQGYIRRDLDPEDHRIKRVRVTEKARGIHGDLQGIFGRWSDVLLGGFTDGERDEALRYLERMAHNAAKYMHGDATWPEACGHAREQEPGGD